VTSAVPASPLPCFPGLAAGKAARSAQIDWRNMTWDLLHLARMLKDVGGLLVVDLRSARRPQRTTTITRWTWLFAIAWRFQRCSTGCVLPAASVARAHRVWGPAVSASHVHAQGRQA
jgi:hypothetical protein